MSNGKSSPRAIVTGGAGFVGSHVADAFLERGYDVLVIDDLSMGLDSNVPSGAAFSNVDITDEPSLHDAVSAFPASVICHLAAQASVTASVQSPARDLEVNVRGTLNVCEAGRRAGAPVVFASTGGALYGNRAPIPTSEESIPAPLAPYGASKLAGEAYVGTWARLHGAASVALRLGNIYGPRQNPHGEAGVVAIFSDRLLHGERPTVFGHGRPTRDYVSVADVSRAFVLAAEGGRPGTFNVGTGRESSVLEVLDALQTAAGTSLEPDLQPLRAGELERSALESRRIGEALGWEARTGLQEGLEATFRWYASDRARAARDAL